MWQLLRSIFGTNMASEEGGHFGNRQQISTSPSSQLLDSLKLYDVCFKLPMIFLYESGSSQQTDEKSGLPFNIYSVFYLLSVELVEMMLIIFFIGNHVTGFNLL